MLEDARPDVGDDARRESRIPALVPDRDDRGDDPGDREHAEDLVERLKVLLAERIVDQELQAKRHDDVEQRLDQHAEGHEGERLAVIGEQWPDEAEDRGERAGGFLGGEDNEILVVVIVIQLVVLALLIVVIVSRRHAGLRRPRRRRRTSHGSGLLLELGIVGIGPIRIV